MALGRGRLYSLSRPRFYTPKYEPEYTFGQVDSGVKPSALTRGVLNPLRLEQLAAPSIHKKRSKYVVAKWSSGVVPAALVAKCSERIYNLSKPRTSFLHCSNKEDFGSIGKNFSNKSDKIIGSSWSPDNRSRKTSMMEVRPKNVLAQNSTVSFATIGYLSHSDFETQQQKKKRIAEWCNLRSQPKPQIQPPLPERKSVDLEEIADHINVMAKPRFVQKKYLCSLYDNSSFNDSLEVKEGPKNYKITDRLKKLAKPQAKRLVKEEKEEIHCVKKSALTYKISPVVDKLAIPRRRYDKKKESEEKLKKVEEIRRAFEVKSSALRYRPTFRILELARPAERTFVPV